MITANIARIGMRDLWDNLTRSRRIKWYLLINSSKFREIGWYVSPTVTIVGVLTTYFGWLLDVFPAFFYGIIITTIGGSLISLSIIYEDIESLLVRGQSNTGILILLAGTVLFLFSVSLALGIFDLNLKLEHRMYIVAVSIQILLISVENHPANISYRARATNLFGHILVLSGSTIGIYYSGVVFSEVLLFYISGFPIIVQHTFWMRTYRSQIETNLKIHSEFWEFIFSLCLSIWIVSTFLLAIFPDEYIPPDSLLSSFLILLSSLSIVLVIALLSAPLEPRYKTDISENYYARIFQHVSILG